MKRWALAAALALPLIGLVVSIGAREAGLSGASEWRIPISGYDPRDPIRGRFIQFRYDWQVTGNPADCRPEACTLCLSDGGRTAIIAAEGAFCSAPVDVNGSNIRLMVQPGGRPPVFSSRIFVSETSAPQLETMLRERPMAVTARLTTGGRLVNDRLEPAD